MEKNDKNKSQKSFLLLLIVFFLTIVLINLNIKKVKATEAYYTAWTSSLKTGVKLVAMSPEGNYLAVAGEDQKIYFFNNKGKLLWDYSQTGFAPTSLSISENANNIIVGFSSTEAYAIISAGKVCSLTKTGGCKWKMDVNNVSSVSVSPYGAGYIGFTFENGLGWSDDLFFFGEGNKWQKGIGAMPSEKTGACAVANAGKYVVAIAGNGGGEGELLEYFNNGGSLLWQYKIPTTAFLNGRGLLAIAGEGQSVVAGSEDAEQIYFFNKNGTLLWQYAMDGKLNTIAISTEGKYIAACSKEGTVALLDNKGQLLWSENNFNTATAVATTSNGNFILVGDSSKISFFAKLQPVVLAALSNASTKISKAKAKGILVPEAEQSYKAAREACAAGTWEEAKTMVEKTITSVDTATQLYENTKSLLGVAQNLITEGEAKKFNLTAEKTLLGKAQSTFKKGAYAEAQTFAKNTIAAATKTIETGTLAKTTLVETSKLIAKEKTENYNMAKPEASYQAALNLYAAADYSGALKLAEESSAKAIDLDNDGLDNEKDFAPYFNNKSLYEICGGIFLLLLLILNVLLRRNLRNRKYQEELLSMKATIGKLKSAGYRGKDLNDFTGRYF